MEEEMGMIERGLQKMMPDMGIVDAGLAKMLPGQINTERKVEEFLE